MSIFHYLPEAFKNRIRKRAGAVTLRDRLSNLRNAGFSPQKIIDAGAFHGEWSLTAASIFPEAQYLLIEPQPEAAPLLKKICARHPSFTHRAALLGPVRGQISFLLEGTNSRIVPADFKPSKGQTLLSLPAERLDELSATAGFTSCDYLKLDLQGHELGALEGAGELFGTVEVIQVEVSWLRIGPVPIAAEVITAFTEKGYRLYDVFGFNYRPMDGALWQTDFIFVRNDSRLIASRDWA